MSSRRLSEVIARIADAYPWLAVGPGTVEVYLRMLRDLDPAAVERAVDQLVATSPTFPSVAAIRSSVIEQQLGLPAPEEAWRQVSLGVTGERASRRHLLNELPGPAREALGYVGGSWAVRTSDRPEQLRRQFLDFYGRLRARAVEQANLASLRGGPPAPGRAATSGQRRGEQ